MFSYIYDFRLEPYAYRKGEIDPYSHCWLTSHQSIFLAAMAHYNNIRRKKSLAKRLEIIRIELDGITVRLSSKNKLERSKVLLAVRGFTDSVLLQTRNIQKIAENAPVPFPCKSRVWW